MQREYSDTNLLRRPDSTAKLAVHYLVMLQETLGSAWMTPEWFRFGASSLANDVLMQLRKQATGVYQSADYFSKD